VLPEQFFEGGDNILGNLNETKPNILDQSGVTSGKSNLYRNKLSGHIAFLLGEPKVVRAVVTGTNWWLFSLVLGFVTAIINLILARNPSICYLMAQDQVRGFEVTLPEAMASVQAWSWFNLILYPLQFTVVLAIIAWFICRVMRRVKGTGDFRGYFGVVAAGAFIITLGRVTGYLIVNVQDLKSLSDLRDLTPGVGLGLLPLLALERIGPFWREVVRGFDLFGIWVVLYMAGAFSSWEGFNKVKSFWLAGIYYSLFIGFRWVIEGPGNQLWHYFWNYGKL
jgi:hypothetical protein